jgi:putative hemolysin
LKEDPFPIILNILYQINIDVLHLENLIVFCMILILLFFSALISGAEVSYFSLTSSDLESLLMLQL